MNFTRPSILAASLVILLALTASAADKYLFTYFMGNGETGVYFAISDDGYHYRPLNGGKPWIPPQHEGQLMRDPHIVRAPGGGFHLVWTWAWQGRVFGHAHSSDLVNWGEHKQQEVFRGTEGVKNIWAPELAWDRPAKEWLVIWSTTIAGRFPESAASLDNGNNHRIYALSTKDFKTFSEPWLFFDPGYPVIDATLIATPAGFDMYFKDERSNPLRKRILRATGPSARGPWTTQGETFTEEWSEGPSVLQIGRQTVVFYDHYRQPQGYRAMRSKDRKIWEDAQSLISIPAKARHGSFLRITAEEAARLEKR